MKAPTILLAAVTALAPTAQAWDQTGHMVVGEIAWQNCTPKARAAVRELVASLDNRFNAEQTYHFVTAPAWMDDMRAMRAEYQWGKLHYVDGPKLDDPNEFKIPEPPHIISAIEENLKTLRDPAATREARVQAVGMLMHFVGDIHQPLHATTWDDKGGNGYGIMGVPFADLLPGMTANLHTFWDKAYRFDAVEGKIVEVWAAQKVDARPKGPGETIIAEEAAKIAKEFPRSALPELKEKGNAESWARESHVLGCTKGYPEGEHPRDTEVRKLEPDFVHAANGIAKKRIATAGYRLADLLNELFP